MPSPDGRVVIVASWSKLHMLDLDTWVVEEVDAPPELRSLVWSPDGSRLFGVVACWRSYQCPEGMEHELWAIDPGERTSRLVATLDFWPGTLHVAPDGDELYTLASPNQDACCRRDAKRATFVAAIDTETGAVRGTVPLPAVLFGQRTERWEWLYTFDPDVGYSPEG